MNATVCDSVVRGEPCQDVQRIQLTNVLWLSRRLILTCISFLVSFAYVYYSGFHEITTVARGPIDKSDSIERTVCYGNSDRGNFWRLTLLRQANFKRAGQAAAMGESHPRAEAGELRTTAKGE